MWYIYKDYGQGETVDMTHRIKYALVMVILGIALAGCGSVSENLEDYYDSMNAFAGNINKIKSDMEAVDTMSPDASAELLDCLDRMEEQFQILSEIEVPEEFISNEELADEAYDYMQQAVVMFHDYYEDPSVDRITFDVANENYTRAMKRVNYISSILQGKLPEGTDYEVIKDDTDFTPVTDESATGDVESGEGIEGTVE